ncbi:serine protease, partial [Streptomyces sp. SID10362]|nr:serine protease [Streptomyces sp. SID10362]
MDMTESLRPNGEYEHANPYQGTHQHASSPVNPEWPPPPAQPPGNHPAQPLPEPPHGKRPAGRR